MTNDELKGYLTLRVAELEQTERERATNILVLEAQMKSERGQHAAAAGALAEAKDILRRLTPCQK